MDCEVVKLRYYKVVDTSGKLISIGTGSDGIEITFEEYEELSSEINEKADLVSDLYVGKISEGEIREDWREEIVRRAQALNAHAEGYTQEALEAMSNAQLEQILSGMGVSANMTKANMVTLILAMQGGSEVELV